MLIGGAGNDMLDGGAGNDTLDGGAGTDTAAYGTPTAAVTVKPRGHGCAGYAAARARHPHSASRISIGSAFDDTLTGRCRRQHPVRRRRRRYASGGAGADGWMAATATTTASLQSDAAAAVTSAWRCQAVASEHRRCGGRYAHRHREPDRLGLQRHPDRRQRRQLRSTAARATTRWRAARATTRVFTRPPRRRSRCRWPIPSLNTVRGRSGRHLHPRSRTSRGRPSTTR